LKDNILKNFISVSSYCKNLN